MLKVSWYVATSCTNVLIYYIQEGSKASKIHTTDGFIAYLVVDNSAAGRVVITLALRGGVDPASQAVGDVTSVAVSGNVILQLASVRNRSRVVDTGRTVEGRDVATAGLVDAVGKSITRVGACSTFTDHFVDGGRRTRILDVAVLIAGCFAVVILHQTWVAYSVVGSLDTDTAMRLLHHDCKNETVVNTSGIGSFLDAVVNGSNFGAAVIGNGRAHVLASMDHLVLVVVEPVHVSVIPRNEAAEDEGLTCSQMIPIGLWKANPGQCYHLYYILV